MLDRTATAWLYRLRAWREPFEDGFSHRAQYGALRRYVQGLLSDSRRKSMEAVWTRLNEPSSYQTLQHFLTTRRGTPNNCGPGCGSWSPSGVAYSSSTPPAFPNKAASVGVARPYAAALEKFANYQVAVTVAL